MNGSSFGGGGNGIHNNLQQLSPANFSGGDAGSYDADNETSDDTFTIDGGADA